MLLALLGAEAANGGVINKAPSSGLMSLLDFNGVFWAIDELSGMEADSAGTAASADGCCQAAAAVAAAVVDELSSLPLKEGGPVAMQEPLTSPSSSPTEVS